MHKADWVLMFRKWIAGLWPAVYSGSDVPGASPAEAPVKHGVGIDSSYSAHECPATCSWWKMFSDAGAWPESTIPAVIAR